MFDIDLWREIFQSISKNRTRSLLSGFTVTFAILLFTILFGLANGLNNTFSEAFVDDAANAMFIRSGTTTKAHKGMQAGRRVQFRNEDYNYIKTDFDDNVEFITSRIYKNVNASFRNEKNNYSLRAVHPDHQYLEKQLKERFLVAPNDQRAVRVFNMAMQNKGINQMTSVLGILILIIGMGTLIAGIVGISNIMIFIVKERTKEIGIRKALGASPKSIVSIILVESIFITTIAGYFGLLLGVGILELVGPNLKTYFITNPSVSISLVLSATLILIGAGSLAGYLPAKKASKIKPIVALRDD